METLGQYLREERQKQGKTLEQIAQRTRISRSTLEAIESDCDELLPPAAYLRGLLKLYAHELCLSAEDVLARLPAPAAGYGRMALPKGFIISSKKKPLLKIYLTIGIICIACAWAWYMLAGFEPTATDVPFAMPSVKTELPGSLTVPAADPGVAATSVPAVGLPASGSGQASGPQPAAAPEQASEPQPPVTPEQAPAAATGPFVVKFIAQGIIWMRIKADDGQSVDITLRSGELYRASAFKRLSVRLGNPSLVDVFYNDARVALNGKPGIPLDVVFPDVVRGPGPDTH